MDVINLNVGGVIYTTTKATLTKFPDSVLAAMFTGFQSASEKDKAGNCFIDRDGKIFAYILNFLRSGQLLLPDKFDSMASLTGEAKFYQIRPLIELLNNTKYVGTIETMRRGSEYGSQNDDTPDVTLTLTGKLQILRKLPNELLQDSFVMDKYYHPDDFIVDELVTFDKSYKKSYLLGEKTTTSGSNHIYIDEMDEELESKDLKLPWNDWDDEERPKETDLSSVQFKGMNMALKIEEYFLQTGWELIRNDKTGSCDKPDFELLQLWALPQRSV